MVGPKYWRESVRLWWPFELKLALRFKFSDFPASAGISGLWALVRRALGGRVTGVSDRGGCASWCSCWC